MTAARAAVVAGWPSWTAASPEGALESYAGLLRDVVRGVCATVALDLRFAGSCGGPVPEPLCCRVLTGAGRLRVTVRNDFFREGATRLSVAHRLAAAAVVLAKVAEDTPAGPELGFTLCLGDDSTWQDVGFCAAGGSLLIPDSDFLGSGGYRAIRDFAEEARLPWSRRKPVVFWRGSTTGRQRPAGSYDAGTEWFRVTQRTELCRRLSTGPHRRQCDVGITAVVQIEDEALAGRIRAELARERVERPWQIWFRFLVDIDGNTSAWANLFEAMLLGACVLKVESPSGFRQWFYDRLEPWTTHIPVRADLSDLDERVAWALANPAQAERIAARGRAVALGIGFEDAVA
ncbi:glycosyl transferase family 90, partial [Enterovirga sp.]|uniref:glycosyl transferase family 90 n=1 Tax=Enterovirga sp. TaxID=2026350 RepID=UPI0026093717